jgi:hypothetical protein
MHDTLLLRQGESPDNPEVDPSSLVFFPVALVCSI